MEAAHITWRPLGRLLVEQGLLTGEELEQALAEQQTSGKRLGETIVALGFVSGPQLAAALASQYGIELTTENGGIELGNDGSIQLSMSATDTADLSFSRGVYDLEIVPPVGEPYKIVKGNVFLKREATR